MCVPSFDPRRKPSHESHKSLRQSTRGPAVFSRPPTTFNRAMRAVACSPVSGHFTSLFIVSFRLIRDRARTLRLHTHTHTHTLSLLPHLFCALAFPFRIATRLGSPSPNSPYRGRGEWFYSKIYIQTSVLLSTRLPYQGSRLSERATTRARNGNGDMVVTRNKQGEVERTGLWCRTGRSSIGQGRATGDGVQLQGQRERCPYSTIPQSPCITLRQY